MPINKQPLSQRKDLVLCKDGTYTLYSHDFNESYHSTKDGALQESLQKHVIPAFLFKSNKNKVTILDICFGLGYNTLATVYYIKKYNLDLEIDIISPEFDESLIRSLKTFEYPVAFKSLHNMIQALSRNLYYEDEQFKIKILLGDAREHIPKIKQKIDIIYQDAFSPTKNPLLWTVEWFRDLRALCSEDAILTTYSVAATVRLALDETGFLLYPYEGKGVRGSLLASLSPLDGMDSIDMVLKRRRNQAAKSLRDKNY